MFQLMIVANLLLLFCKYGECEQVYIIPSVDTPCPAQACYTLMQYINYTSLCHSPNSSNIALIFMPGNHILGTEFPIANKSCFSMSAYSYNTSSSCSVMCNSSSRMTLSSIETVVISGISFTNCGGNTARFVDSFILKDLNFIMDPPSYIVSSYYDIVYTIILYRRRAWSVIGSETLSIDSCTFTTNTASYRGGALYISAVTNVIITLCTFNNNIAGGGGGKGGAMYISAINCIINGSTFFNNTLQGGGAKGGAVYVNAMNSTIYMSIFINNIVRGGSAKGGAIFITATNSVISRATFTNNTARGGSAKGGAISITATNSVISRATFTNNTARGGSAGGGAISITATNSVISRATFTNNTARGGGAQGGALYVKATSSIIGMSTFINNSATHGAPRYIIANPSIISDDAVYEGIQWQDLNFNTTLSNEICDLSVSCYPPHPPINGNVNYTTTLEGSQATYKCDNGFIPYGEFKTTCCEAGQWFPDPMELTCIEEPFNCTRLPSIPMNGVLLNLTSTSATIGCAADLPLNIVTVTCVSQDVWDHPDPTNLLNCSLPTETHRRNGTSGTLIMILAASVASLLSLLISSIIIIMILWAVFDKKKRKGNRSGHGVGPSTTPGPIYEEILPSYSQALYENKWNHMGLELQENTAYQVTTFKLEENTAYAVAAHKECKLQESNQSTTNSNLKDFEFHENTAYISTLKQKDFERLNQENAANMSTLKQKDCELQENAAYMSALNWNDYELQENAAYASTLERNGFELQENAAYASTLEQKDCELQENAAYASTLNRKGFELQENAACLL